MARKSKASYLVSILAVKQSCYWQLIFQDHEHLHTSVTPVVRDSTPWGNTAFLYNVKTFSMKCRVLFYIVLKHNTDLMDLFLVIVFNS